MFLTRFNHPEMGFSGWCFDRLFFFQQNIFGVVIPSDGGVLETQTFWNQESQGGGPNKNLDDNLNVGTGRLWVSLCFFWCMDMGYNHDTLQFSQNCYRL